MTDPVQTQAANAMWGGRFAEGPDAIMTAINASIGFDQRLYAQDIAGSRAHAAMLAAQGILSDSDAKAIGEGLLTVLSEIEGGKFVFSTSEAYLIENGRITAAVKGATLIGNGPEAMRRVSMSCRIMRTLTARTAAASSMVSSCSRTPASVTVTSAHHAHRG